ncbi:hypothetical protein GH714_017665 [Hevea brasiliensis]|uniref:Ionotropic glutamate receptor C-terminal domain-containing protein n=1 Tax=Hevea brasiliensis TaxID=3981 RepID=A0A6A6LH95_HEVBR|nr:hypothetical protein GH714_017665 [Hevea brasiliensis]
MNQIDYIDELMLSVITEERVNSKLTRVVVIISCFVVLLLIESYTAALSSYLTLQQLRPSINDVNELIKMKEKVGYQEGSFVFRILKSWGFDESKLIAYKSAKIAATCYQKEVKMVVFPKGSDLATDISRQILSLIETERLKQIEKKWFGRLQKDCSADNSTSNNDSNRLDLDSFWVLFLFAAIASFLALMIHAAKSVCCEKRREENNRSGNNGRKRQEED